MGPVSGRRGRRSGRSFQPYPQRGPSWVARLVIVIVAIALVAGFAIITLPR